MVAVTLHLGNVEIDNSNHEEGSKACTIVKNDSWKAIVSLL